MNVAIYGKGKLGVETAAYIMGIEGINLCAVCVDSVSAVESEQLVFAEEVVDNRDIPVIRPAELKVLYDNNAVDSVIMATDNELLDFCVRRIAEQGITSIAVVPQYYEDEQLSDDSFLWIEADKPRLPYVEYHISFHCNLKCAGCSHYSNIIPGERFGDFDRFCEDMIRLQDLFWGIGKIRLLGGEPLLNPELYKFVYAARAAFPDADIRIVSNGLLLREDHVQLLEAMRETATYFDVSMYPPTTSTINRISDICNTHGVKLTVTEPIIEFRADMDLHGESDCARAYSSCPASHCAYLCDGHISTCAMPQLIDIYNDKYGLDIRPGENDVIDLYDLELDGVSLLKKLRKPMDICRYCDENRRTFKWFVSVDPKMEEWVADTSKI